MASVEAVAETTARQAANDSKRRPEFTRLAASPEHHHLSLHNDFYTAVIRFGFPRMPPQWYGESLAATYGNMDGLLEVEFLDFPHFVPSFYTLIPVKPAAMVSETPTNETRQP